MKPVRVHNFGTYFVTSATWERRALFRAEPWAKLFLKTLYEYRASGKYLMHGFVLMPDHFHIIITPVDIPLESPSSWSRAGFRSVQAGSYLPHLRFGKRDLPTIAFGMQRIMTVAAITLS